MRLDCHQHFWHYVPSEHGWMTERMDALRRDYLPGELAPLLQSIGFDGSIAVQGRQIVEETRWLLELADQCDFIKGVVGWVDLRSPRVREELEEFAGHPKLVGVRHVVCEEPDDFTLQPEFRRGIAALEEFDLTYDLLVFPRQLPAAVKLATEFPRQSFVLNHLGRPAIRNREMTPWREDLRALARYDNVYCKLSGLANEAVWKQWQAAEFRPYLDIALEAFGPRGVMIGSDWPVCTLSGDYAAVMQIVIDYVKRFPAAVREDILGGNCARVYGVDDT
jgi:L-fuconolactonase